MREVNVVEVTVRDGGYEIGHDYGMESVAAIVSGLDAAGFDYIEIGHGMGFGGHTHQLDIRPKRSVMTDEDHLSISREVVTKAKLGVLFGAPSRMLCPIEELDRLAACKADFVRLAVLPTDMTDEPLAYIERAKSLGLTVSLNLMQTYVASPAKVAAYVARAARAGLDWFYVVDSAGCMRPDEVREYVRAVLGEASVRVGLHAHNNSGLAVANSLAAVDAGATLVDSSIAGLGRATGNAPTEQLVLALQNLGHEGDIDVDAVDRLTQLVRPLLADKGNDMVDVVSGAAKVHSRNVRGLLLEAERRGLPPSRFLLEVGREARAQSCLDRFQLPPEVIEAAAARCHANGRPRARASLVSAVKRRLDPARAHTLRGIRDDLRMRSQLYHKQTVLQLVPRDGFPFSGVLPWESEHLVGVTTAWPIEQLGETAPYPLDMVVLDAELRAQPELAGVGRVIVASWRGAWVDATATLAITAARKRDHKLWLDPTATGRDVRAVLDRLRWVGITPVLERPAGPTAILACTAPSAKTTLRDGDLVVAMANAADMRAWSEIARGTGAVVVAPALGPAIAVQMQAMLDGEVALDRVIAAHDDDLYVELPQAPGRGQAIVDLRSGAIVDDLGTDAALVDRVAASRAQQLTSGRGRL